MEGLLEDRFVHGPVKEKDCVACHDPHAASADRLLVRGGKQLCFSCHPETSDVASRKYQHSPLAEGDCSACHAPHSSSEKGLLDAYGSEFCYNCHDEFQEFMAKRTPHQPASGNCVVCHNNYMSFLFI